MKNSKHGIKYYDYGKSQTLYGLSGEIPLRPLFRDCGAIENYRKIERGKQNVTIQKANRGIFS